MVGMTSHGNPVPGNGSGFPRSSIDNNAAAGVSHKRWELRSRLLIAARKLFTEQGYQHTRPQDICREAGVGQGSFYLYFKDKLDCFLVFTKEADLELSEFVRSYSSAMSFEERIRSILCGAFYYSLANPGVLRAVIADARVLSSYGRTPFQAGTADLLVIVEEAKQRGEIAADFDSMLLVYLILGALSQGDALIMHGATSRHEIIEKITNFIARGARPDIPKDAPAGRHAHPLPDMQVSGGAIVRQEEHLSEKRLNNKRKLYAAARQLFVDEGYDAVGPKEIAHKAGVAVGTFYSYFEDKLDCFMAFTNEAACEMDRYVRRYLSHATTYEEIIRLVLRASFDYSAENPGVYRMLQVDVRLLSKGTHRATRRSFGSLCGYIETLAGAGYIDKSFDSPLLARLIAGAVRQGDAYIARHPTCREQIIQDISRFILHAISASE